MNEPNESLFGSFNLLSRFAAVNTGYVQKNRKQVFRYLSPVHNLLEKKTTADVISGASVQNIYVTTVWNAALEVKCTCSSCRRSQAHGWHTQERIITVSLHHSWYPGYYLLRSPIEAKNSRFSITKRWVHRDDVQTLSDRMPLPPHFGGTCTLGSDDRRIVLQREGEDVGFTRGLSKKENQTLLLSLGPNDLISQDRGRVTNERYNDELQRTDFHVNAQVATLT
ncbi:hypothetical protein BDM02DRAFT_3218821 [Thelephora ganbajun]|uniref:Uncharacterized protein n=1 Tax=Thelephora ganbajun TaxID=370292 RepID=A0ACB6Z3I5_THEGA|nr:hypothetical protein BDM02DRAFT_3218821 [Thelephora ganbajun]